MKRCCNWLLIFFCLFLICNSFSFSRDYPSNWWKPVPREIAHSWEILPQDAGPGEVILSKRNELGILSNFAPTPFTFKGKRYASLEGFWQMMKYPENAQDPRAKYPGLDWKYTREQVAQMVGFDAKRAGSLASQNMKQMDINWVTFEGRRMGYKVQQKQQHYKLIVDAMWAKLMQNPKVKEILLATGDLILRPDHKTSLDSPPAWKYYQIYMEIREQLQER